MGVVYKNFSVIFVHRKYINKKKCYEKIKVQFRREG